MLRGRDDHKKACGLATKRVSSSSLRRQVAGDAVAELRTPQFSFTNHNKMDYRADNGFSRWSSFPEEMRRPDQPSPRRER